MHIPLLKKQIEFLQSKSKVVIYRGAIRSGKTFVGAIWSILKAWKGENVLAISPIYSMCIDNVLATVVEAAELMNIPVRVNKQDKKIYIGKGYIIWRSAENPNTALRGFKVSHVWIDEASFIKTDEAYRLAIGRTSASANRQVIITSSPSGRDWVYNLGQQESAHVIVQALIDNYFLDTGFLELLESQYTGKFARQELYGEIVEFSGGYFDLENLLIKSQFNMQNFAIAFDLGFTQKKQSDFSAYALCGIDNDGNFCVLDIQRWKLEVPQTRTKIKQMIDYIRGSIPECPVYIESNNAGIAICQDLRSEGLRFTAVNQSTSKVARSVGMSSAIEQGRVILKEAEWNEDFKNELMDFSWDDSHTHDDMIDAVVMCFNQLKFGNSGGIKLGRGSVFM